MKVTTIDMPASVGINKLEQGVYEFDMTLLHTDVLGFENGYYLLLDNVDLTRPAYFYLRVGQEAFPKDCPAVYRQESFKLGKFSKLWVEGNALRGTVSIPQHLHPIFDRVVALCEGVVPVGVCSIVDMSIDQQGRKRKRITEVLGCQLLTKDGNNLNTPYSDSFSPLYAMMEQIDLQQRGYFIDSSKSIASSPHVEVRVPKEVPPPSEPYEALKGIVIADVHVKGLDELGLADYCKDSEVDIERHVDEMAKEEDLKDGA